MRNRYALRMQTGHDARTEALVLLDQVRAWRTTDEHWLRVASRIDDLAAALTAADQPAITKATIALELISPLKVARVGDDKLEEAPPPVRERLNQLVHDPDPRRSTEAQQPPRR
jgi:hypothetical protein